MQSVSCPSCGAPKEGIVNLASMAICEHCSQAFIVSVDHVEALGRVGILTDEAAAVFVGDRGRVQGWTFRVEGRLRYAYSGGFWDEYWLLGDDGAGRWLVDDEREFALEERVRPNQTIPPFKNLSPGEWIRLEGKKLQIDEINTGRVFGAQGLLPFAVAPGGSFAYVDASQGSTTATIQYHPLSTEVFIGHWIDFKDLHLTGDGLEDGGSGPGGWSDA